METLIDQAFFITMGIISILTASGLVRAAITLWQQRHTSPSSKSS